VLISSKIPTKLQCFISPIYCHPRYNATKCEEQTVVLYRRMPVYRNKITQYSNSSLRNRDWTSACTYVFLFSVASRSTLMSNQAPMHSVLEGLTLGTERPRQKSGHSPPSSAHIRMHKVTFPPPLHLRGMNRS
jgi:hypothetical protein